MIPGSHRHVYECGDGCVWCGACTCVYVYVLCGSCMYKLSVLGHTVNLLFSQDLMPEFTRKSDLYE